MEEKHSPIGIASFVISIIAIILFIAVFSTAGILHHNYPVGPYPGQTLVGLIAIVLFFADIVAFGLGVASVFQKNMKKTFGILGLIFSASTIVFAMGLLLIGLWYLHSVKH